MRPFVVVNVAMSADGKLSTRERRQVRISGEQDFTRVDRLKSGSDAVMVGIGTVLADDPSLTVKGEDCKAHRRNRGADEHPVRIIIDSKARTPPNASVLHKGEGKRIVVVSRSAIPGTVEPLKQFAEILVFGDDDVDLTALMDELGKRGINRVMVEGGGTLIAGLIAADLVDEIYTYIGNIIIGGKNAPTLADGTGFIKEDDFPQLNLIEIHRIGTGILLHWQVEHKA